MAECDRGGGAGEIATMAAGAATPPTMSLPQSGGRVADDGLFFSRIGGWMR